jgi:type IV pilus assembly protein PilP
MKERKVRRRKVKRRQVNREERRGEPKPLRNKAIGCLLSIAFLFVAGCGGGSPTSSVPSKAKVDGPEKPSAAPAVAVAKEEAKEEVEYAYNPAGKADPFKPFIQLAPVRETSRNVPMTPLQRYEISQLKLVAIISAPEGNVALVEDAAGKGFFLKRGTLIGKNDGKVTKVLKDKVLIEEVYQDVVGQTKQNEVSINLYQAEEGGEP